MIKRQLAILAVALTALLGLPALAATASAATASSATTSPPTTSTCYPPSQCDSSATVTSGGSKQGSSSNSNTPTPSPQKQTSTPANQGILAFTGADVVVTIAVAGLLLAIGLVIVGLTRRRTT